MNMGGAETNARDIVKWAPRAHSLALDCSHRSVYSYLSTNKYKIFCDHCGQNNGGYFVLILKMR